MQRVPKFIIPRIAQHKLCVYQDVCVVQVTSQRTQSMVPTAQTCVPKLYLPDYADGTALRAGMIEAFKNADVGGFHERAMS